MGALNEATIAIETLIVALNQIRASLAAEQAAIDATRDALLGKLGTTTNTQIRQAARSTITATERLREAADHLRSAIDSASTFAAELGPPQFRAVPTSRLVRGKSPTALGTRHGKSRMRFTK